MTTTQSCFGYPPALQEYTVSEKDFLVKNPQWNIICTGAVVFDSKGKMLLVQRAKEERAFPNCWEIPGGKVDDTDESILHAVARELKEETGLEAIKIVRKVGEFGWDEFSERRQERFVWRKFIFEVEVKKAEDVKLDPVEHQDYLWASEEEVNSDKAGNIPLSWITAPNKNMNLEAFRLRREKNDGVSL